MSLLLLSIFYLLPTAIGAPIMQGISGRQFIVNLDIVPGIQTRFCNCSSQIVNVTFIPNCNNKCPLPPSQFINCSDIELQQCNSPTFSSSIDSNSTTSSLSLTSSTPESLMSTGCQYTNNTINDCCNTGIINTTSILQFGSPSSCTAQMQTNYKCTLSDYSKCNSCQYSKTSSACDCSSGNSTTTFSFNSSITNRYNNNGTDCSIQIPDPIVQRAESCVICGMCSFLEPTYSACSSTCGPGIQNVTRLLNATNNVYWAGFPPNRCRLQIRTTQSCKGNSTCSIPCTYLNSTKCDCTTGTQITKFSYDPNCPTDGRGNDCSLTVPPSISSSQCTDYSNCACPIAQQYFCDNDLNCSGTKRYLHSGKIYDSRHNLVAVSLYDSTGNSCNNQTSWSWSGAECGVALVETTNSQGQTVTYPKVSSCPAKGNANPPSSLHLVTYGAVSMNNYP